MKIFILNKQWINLYFLLKYIGGLKVQVNIEAQSICNANLRGIPFYTLNLIKELVKRNYANVYSVSFFDYKKERNNRQFIDSYLGETNLVNIYECNELNYKDIINACATNDFRVFSKSYGEYLKCDADIFHFPLSAVFPYMNIRNCIVTVHDIIPIILIDKKYWSEKATAAFVNCHNYIAKHEDITLITDSECTKQDIMNYLNISSERIFVTPLGYDESIHFHEENRSVLLNMGIDSPYILYLGALDLRKGIPDILKAFHCIKSKYKGLKLVLSGKKSMIFESQYWDLINGISLEDVIFTGYVTDEQKRVLLSSTEAFLFPSEYEGFGLPVLEAMACGSPVITTNVSSIPEVGGDGVIYVSPNQPEELAEAIKKFLDSKELQSQYICKGYEQAKQFSWGKTAACTEEIYKIAYERTH